MANLPLTKLVLYDRFPGAPNPNLGIPSGGWNNTTDNEVTSPTYPPGTKIQAYSDNSHAPGHYIMYYGSFAAYSADADVSGDYSDGRFWCSHCCLTDDVADATYEIASGDGSSQPPHVLAACFTTLGWDGTKGSPIAVPCATLDGYDYGWFWVGGVCPASDVTILRGLADSDAGADVTTDDVQAGDVFLEYTATTGLMTACDITQITDATGAIGRLPIPIGYVLEAD